jgi:hypothetical protein
MRSPSSFSSRDQNGNISIGMRTELFTTKATRLLREPQKTASYEFLLTRIQESIREQASPREERQELRKQLNIISCRDGWKESFSTQITWFLCRFSSVL